jgi:hypothetical protein
MAANAPTESDQWEIWRTGAASIMLLTAKASVGNLVLLSGLTLWLPARAQNVNIEVSDPRPVAKAVAMIERIYGMPVTYEDPITEHPSQLEDVTDSVSRDPDRKRRIVVQKRMTLHFAYHQRNSLPSLNGNPEQFKAETETAVADAVASVLAGYAEAGGRVTFVVRREEGAFHVVPETFVDPDGKIEPMPPTLDTKITIPAGQRSREALLQDICAALTERTGTRFAGVVNSGSMTLSTSISGEDIPAHTLISRLLAEIAAPVTREETSANASGEPRVRKVVVRESLGTLSWRLLYGAGSGYALNVHRVIMADEQP